MLTITLRDLQWRARRFGLGVAATALVFSTTLLLAGVYASFHREADRAIGIFKADVWYVPAGVSGPFTGTTPVTSQLAQRAARTPGITRADGVVFFRSVVNHDRKETIVNVIGAAPGAMLAPPVTAGRAPRRDGEVLADDKADLKVGERVRLGPLGLTVVGHTERVAYLAGTPALITTLADARRLAYSAQPLSTALIATGRPRAIPGLKLMRPAEVIDDLRRPVGGATATILAEAILLAAVAAGIIGLMTYLSGLDRTVDFAVFKAIGVRNSQLMGGLVIEVLALSLASAAIAAVVAVVIAPAFPLGVELTLATFAMVFALALVVGLVVSVLSIRQAARIDPALAFGTRLCSACAA